MDYQGLAKIASRESGIPWEWIYAQWVHETGNFSSYLTSAYNNYGGLKAKTGDYMQFATPEDFATYFGSYLRLYEPDGLYQAKTPEEYVRVLKNGGYFEDSYKNYIRGVQAALEEIGQGSTNAAPSPGGVKTETVKQPSFFSVEYWTEQGKKAGLFALGAVLVVSGVFILTRQTETIAIIEQEE